MILNVLLQAAASAAPAGKPGLFGGGYTSIIFIVVIIVIMYFFMMRPQQKKQKELEKQRNAAKQGDKVVTAGGIHGKIKEIGDTFFVVEIAEGVKIKVEKTSVHLVPNA